ncbi:MAG: HK97 family phage prohead protease [Pseudomonadota bacterium]
MSAPMRAAARHAVSRRPGPILIEGYASVFGVEDRSGDIVRAGAFARSLRERSIPMLLQHKSGAIAGMWTRVVENGHGLLVRGMIESERAVQLARSGLDGLSIGFRPRVWTHRRDGGRVLAQVELVEISLVAEPMLPAARFERV